MRVRADDRLDLVDLLGDSGTQVYRSLGAAEDVVFDPYADPLEAFVDLDVTMKIETGLDRHHHPGLEEPRALVRGAIPADVVDVEPEVMAGAMHVKVLVGPLLDRIVDRALQNAQIDQPFAQDAHGRLMVSIEGFPGTYLLDPGLLGGEDDLVDRALLAAEAPVDRPGARHVGRIAVELRRAVDEDERSVAQLVSVRMVVEDRRVVPAGDDRGIGNGLCTVAMIRVFQDRLDLVLVGARGRRLHRSDVTQPRDRCGAPHRFEFSGVLVQTHLVEDRPRFDDLYRSLPAAADFPAGALERRQDAPIEPFVPPERVVQRLVADEQRRELRIEFVDRIGGVDLQRLRRRLDPQAPPVPDLLRAITRAQEKDLARDVRARRDDEGGIRLAESRQIIEI